MAWNVRFARSASSFQRELLLAVPLSMGSRRMSRPDAIRTVDDLA
jgi:hypothetical protein